MTGFAGLETLTAVPQLPAGHDAIGAAIVVVRVPGAIWAQQLVLFFFPTASYAQAGLARPTSPPAPGPL